MKKALLVSLSVVIALAAVSCKKDKKASGPRYGVDGVTPLPTAIDMGTIVNGKTVNWASFNLGASRYYEYGGYYAWGETVAYCTSMDPVEWAERDEKVLHYDWASYIHANGSKDKLIKYCPDTQAGAECWDNTARPEGPDGNNKLLPSDDVVHVKLGGKWRMPKEEDFAALLALKENSNYTWEEMALVTDSRGNEIKDFKGNAIYGLRITRKSTGATLFFPAAGYCEGENVAKSAGSNGYYWSSSLGTGTINARSMTFSSSIITCGPSGRIYGFQIRPVVD